MQSQSTNAIRTALLASVGQTDDCTAETPLNRLQRICDRKMNREQFSKTHCSYCGKSSEVALKCCSHCKGVRYCDEACQRADYKPRHKLACTTFARLPTTMAFQSEADAEERFPQHPVFAHAHKDDVGMWVTIEGRIDCKLQPLLDSLDPEVLRERYINTMTGPAADASYAIMRTNRAYSCSLLSLRILVQNRRKDDAPILVFSSRAQMVVKASSTEAVQRGKTDCDNAVTFTQDGIERTVLGVANDPWDHVPRLLIHQFNTTEHAENMMGSR
ncbi:hypothetical protein VTO73DRAFT_15146, partial [Trametes versicolor]